MDANFEDLSANANEGWSNVFVQTEDDSWDSLEPRAQAAALMTNELLAKLLDAVKEQTKRNNEGMGNILSAVNARVQHNDADPGTLLGTVKSIHTLLRKLEPKEDGLHSSECEREEGKRWPEDRYYFRGRLKYYERKWKDVDTELAHLETHYRQVGGDRGVIEASLNFRKALCSSIKPLHDVNGADYEEGKVRKLKESKDITKKAEGIELQKTLQDKYRGYREAAEKCKKELTESAKRFHESLYRQKHAFYFRRMGECCNVLENAKLSLRDEGSFLRSMLDNVYQPMEVVIFEVIREIQAFREKALPVFLTEEKERITNRYLNITTIATFFSSVTATALAISLQSDNDPSTYATVNLFWFISLVFSVSSGVSSLLAMLWHNSRIFYPNPPPPEVRFWFERAPMVSLVIAALTFVVGLNIYVYVSAQAFIVSMVTSAFTGLHTLCLFCVVLWFLCQLYKEQMWASLLIKLFKALRRWNITTITTQIKHAIATYYEKHLNLMRNINWAIRLDNRVGFLNTLAVQKFDPERPSFSKPCLAARIIRAMMFPVQLIKDFRSWIVSQKRERQHSLTPGANSSQMDLEHTGDLASEMLWMNGFRNSLTRTFRPNTVQCMLAEINDLEFFIDGGLAEQRRQRGLKLDILFWGYQDLLKKFNSECLEHLQEYRIRELKVDPTELCLQDGSHFACGKYSSFFAVQISNKTYAVKASRHGTQRKTYDLYVRKKIRHENIMPLIAVYYGYHGPGTVFQPENIMNHVFPMMRNGDLEAYLRVKSPIDSIALCLEIARGLQYLHSLEIIHGNLKPTNVLIDDQGHPKISGFGSAITNLTGHHGGLHASVTDLYIAPERIENFEFWMPEDEGEDSDVKVPTKESDIYSFACICFEVYALEPAWSGLKRRLAVLRVIEGRRADRPDARGLTDDVWFLITRCWAQDPKERPTIDEVVQEFARIHTLELASQTPIASTSGPVIEAVGQGSRMKEA